MKKFVIFTVIVMISCSMNLFAQKSVDDIINIREKVSEKIDAMNKEETKKLSKKVQTNKENIFIGGMPVLSKNTLIKSFVFVEGSLLILIGFTLKRRLLDKKKHQMSRLKENIRKLRAERIGSIFDVSHYKVRRQLRMQPIKISEREITRRAKEYSISKGEIHLALNINLMQNNR